MKNSFAASIVAAACLCMHGASGHPNDSMSRHLLLESASGANVVMVAEAETTGGPFDEEEADYMDTTDMLAAAVAGGPGIMQAGGRSSVLDGIPLNLTMTLYNVDLDSDVGREIGNAEVYVWHCDTMGIYSAVEHRMQTENTEGQKWLRSKSKTASDGTVSFQTILPGWYGGRPIHYHFRIRLPGETAFAATSQLFVRDADLALYQDVPVYADNEMRITSLSDDRIFGNLPAGVGEALTLGLSGSNEAGYSSSLRIGLSYDAPFDEETPVEESPVEEDGDYTISMADEAWYPLPPNNMTNITTNAEELLNTTTLDDEVTGFVGDSSMEVTVLKSQLATSSTRDRGRVAFQAFLPMAFTTAWLVLQMVCI